MLKRWWFVLVMLFCSVLLIAGATEAQPLLPPGDMLTTNSVRPVTNWPEVGTHSPQTGGRAGLLLLAPTIRVEPQSSTVQAGSVFTVEIRAGDAVDLGAFDFVLTFNPAVLSVQGAALGSFLGSTGRTTGSLGPLIDNVAGSVRFGAFSFGTAAGPSGGGTLAVFTLQALGPGTSPLHFAAMQYTDTKIPVHTAEPEPTDGSVTVLVPRAFLPLMAKSAP